MRFVLKFEMDFIELTLKVEIIITPKVIRNVLVCCSKYFPNFSCVLFLILSFKSKTYFLVK